MTVSTTDICNQALSLLGANPIIDTNDKTPEAQLCSLQFDSCRDAVLDEINWTFATRRIRLENPLNDPPVFGYSRAYQIPNEVLRVIEVNDNEQDWAVEERRILVNAERCDINEEIARLRSHLDQFERDCNAREPVGRKLDFLAQEMLREANTLGSKANDAAIARHVIEIKGAIDRLKEQVQNVE